MYIALLNSSLEQLFRALRLFADEHARMRRNARAYRQLEALPDYLRRDIGLGEDADIAEVVEHGLVRPAVDGENAPRQADTLPCAA